MTIVHKGHTCTPKVPWQMEGHGDHWWQTSLGRLCCHAPAGLVPFPVWFHQTPCNPRARGFCSNPFWLISMSPRDGPAQDAHSPLFHSNYSFQKSRSNDSVWLLSSSNNLVTLQAKSTEVNCLMGSALSWQSVTVFTALVLPLVTVGRTDLALSACALSPPPLLLFKSRDIQKVVALLDATEVSLESMFSFPSGGCYLSLNLHRLFPGASTPLPFQSRLGTAPSRSITLKIQILLLNSQLRNH